MVHFLHAYQTCITLPDLFDYARASKGKVEHFFGLAWVVIHRSELISQYIVAHDVKGILYATCSKILCIFSPGVNIVTENQ